ncbi:TIGR00266 family protein [Candidatus Dojkabacteria bacterium]|nr:TIGR00266 family protein [Candidatus Dojkabacteria bacterium]
MATKLDYKIHGDDMQAVEIFLDEAEKIRSEVGTMLYMDPEIDMQTNAEGGFVKSIKRAFTGESFFITSYINSSAKKKSIAFAAPYPGKIIPIDLEDTGKTLFCQRDSYLCSEAEIDVDIAFTKRLGAGFFGGEGFILQKLSGNGLVFVHAGGTVIQHELKEGESLDVDTGCLVAFTEDVDYDIRAVKGVMNALFGGEGIFLAHLEGPGTVYLQSLPFSRIADRIMAVSGRRHSSGGGSDEVTRAAGKVIGRIING